jgi:hypothetical protein
MTEPSNQRPGGEAEPQTRAEAVRRAQEGIKLQEVSPVEPKQEIEEDPASLSPREDE